MSSYDSAFDPDLGDLAPMRLPTATLDEIDQLSKERRTLLQDLSIHPYQLTLRERLASVDERLEQLWERRRKELRHIG
jgi:hypothetical protein